MAFYRSLIFLLLLFFTANLLGQEKLSTKNRSAIKDYQAGLSLYSLGKIKEASASLISAVSRDPHFIEAYLVLGDLYHNQKDYSREIGALKKAVEIDSTFFPTTFLNIGVASYMNEDYDESILWLERYRWQYSSKSSIDKVNLWLDRARFAQKAVENAYEIELKSMDELKRSGFDEYWPSLTADEQTMIVTVLMPRDLELFKERHLPKSSVYFHEDFFLYEKIDSVWAPIKRLAGNINTSGNEGAQTLSADGNWMFFTACGRPDGKGSCDIYFSQRRPDGWSEPVNLGMPINTPYWESQPSFSSDGKTLYFVSNRPGGVGGKDIWQATVHGFKNDGTPIFGHATCLGQNINTKEDENSPFIHHDNNTLYFSSSGKPGMGGMDIFFSRRGKNGDWQPAVNVGYPINTAGDEIGFVINAKANCAYFSSDGRDENSLTKNIYWFDLPPAIRPNPVIYVKGRVYDSETEELLAADFNLQDIESGLEVVASKGNQTTGEFLVCLPLGGRYSFRASHPGYLFYSGHFDIKENHPLDAPYYIDVALHPIKKGATITLRNIFFELNSFELQDDSKVELDGLIKFMKNNSDVKIQVSGHTDNQGNANYNQQLSENRARSVKKYLINGGVATDRLESRGFGMSHPVDSNETEEGRANNRRTEITIL